MMCVVLCLREKTRDLASVSQVNLSHAEAFAGAHNGEYWGVIEFGKNFTSYLTKR